LSQSDKKKEEAGRKKKRNGGWVNLTFGYNFENHFGIKKNGLSRLSQILQSTLYPIFFKKQG